MNCLQKELEMDLDLVWIFGPKEMGWFGGTAEDLPERDLRRDQYLAGLDRWSDLERVSSQRWRACWEKEDWIRSFRILILGSEGFWCLKESLSVIRRLASGGEWGVNDLRKPAGMECFEAVLRIFLKDFSPLAQEEGVGRDAKSSSVSRT